MLYEDEVVNAVCDWLEASGWHIESRALATQHGDDIVASRNGHRLIVEAKGEGSSKSHTKRFGQVFNRGQVLTHVSVGILRALKVASAGDALAAVAFPDNSHHRELAEPAQLALSRAGVGVFWVTSDKQVSASTPWDVV